MSVISSTKVRVNKLSIIPIPAIVNENGSTINNVDKFKGTEGI